MLDNALRSLKASLDRVDQNLKNEEIGFVPEEKMAKLKKIEVSITNLKDEIVKLQILQQSLPSQPHCGILSLTEAVTPLNELSASMKILEDTGDILHNFSTEHIALLENLTEPFEKLSVLLVENQNALGKVEEVAVQKPKLKKVIAALRENVQNIVVGLRNVQKMEIIYNALSSLKAALGNVNENFDIEEIVLVSEEKGTIYPNYPNIRKSLNRIEMELLHLQATIANTSKQPSKSALSIVNTLEAFKRLSLSIATLEMDEEKVGDVPIELELSLESLCEPTEQLLELITELKNRLNKPKETASLLSKLDTVLLALKKNVEDAETFSLKTKSLEKLDVSLKNLSSVLENAILEIQNEKMSAEKIKLMKNLLAT